MADVILCGVVIEKTGEVEKFCTYEAKVAFPLMDEDNVTPVDGIALCELHESAFENGKPLVCATRKGKRFLIQAENSEGEPDIITEKGGTPPASHNTPAPN